MKKGKVLKRLFSISLCAVLLILSLACTSTTPTSTSVETLPLLLRYVDAMNYQDQLLKVTWNTKTGTVEIDTSTTLAFPNYASESNFWVTLKPWIGLPLQPPERNSLSNTAIYWDGSDTATLFTTEKDLFVGLQEIRTKENIKVKEVLRVQEFSWIMKSNEALAYSCGLLSDSDLENIQQVEDYKGQGKIF